jgi:identified by metaGeneAnnotator
MAQLPLYLTSEIKDFTVGMPEVLQSFFEYVPYGVVFEDDGDTGYFYATSKDGILDALHIYNVEDVSDKHIPNHVLILWDDACTLAALCINDYIHAVYDFVAQAGYCRNGFPEAHGEWVKVENRVLDDELLDKLLSRKST